MFKKNPLKTISGIVTDGEMARAMFKVGAAMAIIVPRDTAVKAPKMTTPQSVKNLPASLFKPAIQ